MSDSEAVPFMCWLTPQAAEALREVELLRPMSHTELVSRAVVLYAELERCRVLEDAQILVWKEGSRTGVLEWN